jgi:hypothetical protein
LSLKLVKRKGSDHWYLRGTVRKQSVFESTGTDDKKAAEAILTKRAARLLEDSVYGRKASVTFFEAAVSYMASGGIAQIFGRRKGRSLDSPTRPLRKDQAAFNWARGIRCSRQYSLSQYFCSYSEQTVPRTIHHGVEPCR